MEPFLHGCSIYLRPVEHDDSVHRVAWLNDPEINRTLDFELPVGEAMTREWIRRVSADGTRRDMTVCDLTSRQPIGWGGLLAIDWRHRKAESYLGIGDKHYWGTGVAGQVRLLLLELAFDVMGLNRVYSTVWVENLAMQRLNERAGLRREGVLRAHKYAHGQYRDYVVYGILRSDYESDKQAVGSRDARS
ncbi:GNAT family N-acetyltransferase [Billgrantia lactosivorans]|uniref:GNAT family N-acetyltransferase n=1 Tax=Billgrantia lactosivorans TaxID=2185141 RepID=UPI0013A6AE2D|nr:GNAT family protein [Halomonas lactosivorans]